MLEMKKYTVIGFSRRNGEVQYFWVKGFDKAHAVREAYWHATANHDIDEKSFGLDFVVVAVLQGHATGAVDDRVCGDCFSEFPSRLFRIAKALSVSALCAAHPDSMPSDEDPDYWPGAEDYWEPEWLYRYILPDEEEDDEARYCLAPWDASEITQYEENEARLLSKGPELLMSNMIRNANREFGFYDDYYHVSMSHDWQTKGMPVGDCPHCDREMTAADFFDEDGLVPFCPACDGIL